MSAGSCEQPDILRLEVVHRNRSGCEDRDSTPQTHKRILHPVDAITPEYDSSSPNRFTSRVTSG
jgi:hypothetical protein